MNIIHRNPPSFQVTIAPGLQELHPFLWPQNHQSCEVQVKFLRASAVLEIKLSQESNQALQEGLIIDLLRSFALLVKFVANTLNHELYEARRSFLRRITNIVFLIKEPSILRSLAFSTLSHTI